MKRPSTRTLFMGHPVVATPMTLACGSCLFAAIVNGSSSVVVLILPVLIAVLKASRETASYREWMREWDAMGGGPRPSAWRWLRWPGAIAVAMGTLVLVGSGRTVLAPLAEVVGGVVALLVAIVIPWTVIRWLLHLRHRRHSGAFAVQIIAQPVMQAATLNDAYRALPPHCVAMLGKPK